MQGFLSRTTQLIGENAVQKLQAATVAVFGLGGVGSYVAETLARLGVGRFVLVDNDVITLSNLNRQLIALHSTLGKSKTEMMRDRILDINPQASVEIHTLFFEESTAGAFDFHRYSAVADAIDSIPSKILLIERATAAGVPIVSCMGTGNKLNPALFETADIYKTSVCPLAKAVRAELKKRNIPALKAVYSKEQPMKPLAAEGGGDSGKRRPPASVSFVPPAAGLLMTRESMKEIIK
jgi:tRNA A37 threonylcarbamoyladenosine dehydratase